VRRIRLGFLAATLLTAAVPCHGLERASARLADLRPESGGDWSRGCSNTIAYYNSCTGWIWAWGGWGGGEKVGAYYQTDLCTDYYGLWASWHYVVTAAPSGYGFTGTMAVRYADPFGCPAGSEIASRPFSPQPGWNVVDWNLAEIPMGVQGYTVVWTNGPLAGNPLTFGSDRPSAGPTGPPACGTCYPTTRVPHSFRFGSAASPLCPGEPFTDGDCVAELLWDIAGPIVPWTPPAVSAEERTGSGSWGKIKSLYR